MIKKLPTTDMADIINICFQKKEHFAFFSTKEATSLNLWLIRWPNGKNFLFFYTGTLLKPIKKISKSQSRKDATDFINFIETTKVKKPNVSCFGPRNA